MVDIKQERETGLDLLRVLASLFVVAVHFYLNCNYYQSPLGGDRMFIMTVARWFFLICVPLFMILTGYLKCHKTLSWAHYKSLIPVLVSYVLICIVKVIVSNIYYGEGYYTLGSALEAIATYQMAWYVGMYVALMILIPFLNKLWSALNQREQRFLIAALSIVACVYPLLLYVIPSYWQILYPLVYYFLGAYCRNYRPNCNKWALVGIVALTTLFNGGVSFYCAHGGLFNWNALSAVDSGYGTITVVICATAFFLLLYQVKIKSNLLSRLLARISSVSLEIYLFTGVYDVIIFSYLKKSLTMAGDFFWYFFLTVPINFVLSVLSGILLKMIIKAVTGVFHKKQVITMILSVGLLVCTTSIFCGCGKVESRTATEHSDAEPAEEMTIIIKDDRADTTSVSATDDKTEFSDTDLSVNASTDDTSQGASPDGNMSEANLAGNDFFKVKFEENGPVFLNPSWEYASMAKIIDGAAMFYRAEENRTGLVVAVNAGHGTKGGEDVKTYCHPDMSPKVTGGTTAAGETEAVAVSVGMEFDDGTAEHEVTLQMAQVLKDKLLAAGYDVLMLRDSKDVQLDNVARTVISNNVADVMVSIHWDLDGKSSDQGSYYLSVPNGMKEMSPVDRTWHMSEELGAQIIHAIAGHGLKIAGEGSSDVDLTQTAYSTIPSIVIEYGNQCADHTEEHLEMLAQATMEGIDSFFDVAN